MKIIRNIKTDNTKFILNSWFNYFTKLHEGIMKLHEEKKLLPSWTFVPTSWIFV